MGKDVLEAFLEAIDIVVDQVLPMDFTLIDETNESKALVNFTQVQNDVLLIVCMRQSNYRRGLLVEL